jgi:hypothetical protein
VESPARGLLRIRVPSLKHFAEVFTNDERIAVRFDHEVGIGPVVMDPIEGAKSAFASVPISPRLFEADDVGLHTHRPTKFDELVTNVVSARIIDEDESNIVLFSAGIDETSDRIGRYFCESRIPDGIANECKGRDLHV